MAIIKAKHKSEKIQIRIAIENHTLEKIKQYCAWVDIKKQDDFFQQAAEYVLSKDRDWNEHISKQDLINLV
jgi:predicted DNA binding CopG/RHH family protein